MKATSKNLVVIRKQQNHFTLSSFKAKLVKLLQYLSLAGGLLW